MGVVNASSPHDKDTKRTALTSALPSDSDSGSGGGRARKMVDIHASRHGTDTIQLSPRGTTQVLTMEFWDVEECRRRSTESALGPAFAKVNRAEWRKMRTSHTESQEECHEGEREVVVEREKEVVCSRAPGTKKEETIAARVRKRRESERETATLPQSFSVECFSTTPAPTLTVSQSDFSLHMATPQSFTRPLRRARRRISKRASGVSVGSLGGGHDKNLGEQPICTSSPNDTEKLNGL